MAPSKATTIDFSNVKEGGNFNRNRIPSGDYLAQIVKVEDAPSKKDDIMQYLYSIKIAKHPSRIFPYYCKLQENQLWKLRNIMIAAGINVPKKKMKVDPNRIVGKTIGVTIEDAEYDGKEQSEIASIFPAAELQDGNLVDDDQDVEDTEEGDEEDYATDADVEEDEEEVEEEAEDEPADNLDELDRAELKKMIQVINGADWKAKKSQSDDDLREILRAATAEEPEEDEEEEEEEPAPVVKKKAKPAAKKKKAAEVTDDELEELDIDDI